MDCTSCGEADIETERQDPCSCHINPPCSSCTDAPFVCRSCGEIFEIEHPPYTPSTTKPYELPKAKTLSDLDRSKIDYVHTGKGAKTFHDIHGYSPNGTTRDDILMFLNIKDRQCLPKFESFTSGGYFNLSYFID